MALFFTQLPNLAHADDLRSLTVNVYYFILLSPSPFETLLSLNNKDVSDLQICHQIGRTQQKLARGLFSLYKVLNPKDIDQVIEIVKTKKLSEEEILEITNPILNISEIDPDNEWTITY